MKKTIIWCIGNPLMRDDGVGPALFTILLNSLPQNMEVVNCETTPENWIAKLRNDPPETLVVVDAADMGLSGGTIRRIKLPEMSNISFSNHGIPLSLLLEPFCSSMEIIVLGVQPKERGFGMELSPEATVAIAALAKILARGQLDEITLYQANRSPR